MKPLALIFEECGCQKQVHEYAPGYEKFLAPLRTQRPCRILEVGVLHGASIKAWLEYFEHPEICCIDIRPQSRQAVPEGVRFFCGNSADRTFLERVLEKTGGDFDLIVDDGGHRMHEQQIALRVLWPAVRKGGVYVVEDLQTSFAASGYNPALWPGTVSILADMVTRCIRVKTGFVCPMFAFYNSACFIWKPREITHQTLYPPDHQLGPHA